MWWRQLPAWRRQELLELGHGDQPHAVGGSWIADLRGATHPDPDAVEPPHDPWKTRRPWQPPLVLTPAFRVWLEEMRAAGP
ncbi:hypothetical protein [Kineococcus terrestris]|uniref:hypothetical protein n=1 Tax=Kineococcus terrestris TaxID=2044856 RepID=UPI0034DB547D